MQFIAVNFFPGEKDHGHCVVKKMTQGQTVDRGEVIDEQGKSKTGTNRQIDQTTQYTINNK